MEAKPNPINLNLRSVKEHNSRIQMLRDWMHKTGVACPKCGTEMRWAERDVAPMLTQKTAECPHCGHKENRLSGFDCWHH